MMNKDKSTPIKRLKLLLILPLISIILVGFAKPNYVSEGNTNVVATEGTMKIKGKVLDESGEPLPGASVIISNTTIGTLSDINGNFILEGVKSSDNIYVSFVGYKTLVTPAKKEMTFKMEREIVLIEVRKEEILPPLPVPEPNVKIRSKDGETPLIVIDGVISNIDVSKIEPESIEKMEVLKDESATKLYGEKGKNGVILISTKKNTEPVRESPNNEVFIVVEDMPQYPGGVEALQQYIQKEVAGSKESGKVYVTFTIDQKGNVTNARLASSTNEKLNAKALKIVNNMQKWEPGKQRGKAVKVDYTTTIVF